MAYVQSMTGQTDVQNYNNNDDTPSSPASQRSASKQQFVAELSQCLYDFVIQLLPTSEEMAVKEDVRKLLERLIRTIEPNSRLLSFGSSANGFSLRNSDMDLCCLLDSKERLSATDLVTKLGDLLERETKFRVKPLPHARIPIVKLSLDPSPGLPLGIACDIGFENRLALENTRLLMCYAMVDPTRVRTMVLFLKVWSKRRKINSPYQGTLSSYGYVLLVIYFLVHVKNPPVLPNLQQIPPLRPISQEDTHLGGYNTWFFDDIDLLRQKWISSNTDSVADLLIDFFRYYSRDFSYNTGVASIRAGLLKKESKGWQNNLSSSKYNDLQERNRLCIEDPFELDYNVARCVTRDGLYNIRGEFMRAVRILTSRPERVVVALSELCEERKEEEPVSPLAPFVPPRLSLPPQTPYTVGSQSLRPKGAPEGERLSPPANFFEPGYKRTVQTVTIRAPPEHMAPKRSKWTSPPPPEAADSVHSQFEHEFGKGLELATTSTEAREPNVKAKANDNEGASWSSSNSEHMTDDELPVSELGVESDFGDGDVDARSIRSFTEGSSSNMMMGGRTRTNPSTSPRTPFSPSGSTRRPMWLQAHAQQQTAMRVPTVSSSVEFEAATGGGVSLGVNTRAGAQDNGNGSGLNRLPLRMMDFSREASSSTSSSTAGPSILTPNFTDNRIPTPLRTDFNRRQIPSTSSRSPANRFSWAGGSPGGSSSQTSSPLMGGGNMALPMAEQTTVFYQTPSPMTRSPKLGFAGVGSPVVGLHSPLSPHYTPLYVQQLQQAQLQQAQLLQQQLQLQHQLGHLHLHPSIQHHHQQPQQQRHQQHQHSSSNNSERQRPPSSSSDSQSLSPSTQNQNQTPSQNGSPSHSPSLSRLSPSPSVTNHQPAPTFISPSITQLSPSLSQLTLHQDPAIVEVSPNRYTFNPASQEMSMMNQAMGMTVDERLISDSAPPFYGDDGEHEVRISPQGAGMPPALGASVSLDGRIGRRREEDSPSGGGRLNGGCTSNSGMAGGGGVVGSPGKTSDDPRSPSSLGYASSLSRSPSGSPPSLTSASAHPPSNNSERGSPYRRNHNLSGLNFNVNLGHSHQAFHQPPPLTHSHSFHNGLNHIHHAISRSQSPRLTPPANFSPSTGVSGTSTTKRMPSFRGLDPLPVVALEPSLRRAISAVIGKGQGMRAELPPTVSLNER